MIDQYLADLEARIDPAIEDQLESDWREFLAGRFQGDIFSPRRAAGSPPSLDWPRVSINQTLDDPQMMLLHQFRMCSEELASGSGGFLCVRANYGTGILPSLFGVRPFIMDEALDTLPTNWPLDGGKDAIRKVVDRGLPDLTSSLGGKTLDMGRLLVETVAKYPRLRRYVHVYHPDLQGPLDVCELLWGSSLFLDLYDEPELVTRLLQLLTDTYAAFLRLWDQIAPLGDGETVHWTWMHRGRIMLRDDSAMNLSSEMFDVFVAPFDGQLLREFGGGAMHFCGKGDHYIAKAAALPGLHAIAMSQPEYNDLETIFAHTIDQGLLLLGFPGEALSAVLASGRPLHGRVHGRV